MRVPRWSGLSRYECWKRHIAYQYVRKALKHGELIRQPCTCGNPKSEAHHRDYSLPLAVEWVCRTCHARIHAAMPRKRSPRPDFKGSVSLALAAHNGNRTHAAKSLGVSVRTVQRKIRQIGAASCDTPEILSST